MDEVVIGTPQTPDVRALLQDECVRLAAEELGLPTSPYRFCDTKAELDAAVRSAGAMKVHWRGGWVCVEDPTPSGGTPVSTIEAQPADVESQPHLDHEVHEVQKFTQLRELPIGLDADVRSKIAAGLNQVLADTRILHDLYKKAHWNMRGHTFYQLHLLMDDHAEKQEALIDSIAERIQTLGAIAVGDPRHVAEITTIPRPPDGAETVPNMLTRLLDAHEKIVVFARELAEKAGEHNDTTTEDLLGSEVTPVNELQIWFVAEHLVDIPVVDA